MAAPLAEMVDATRCTAVKSMMQRTPNFNGVFKPLALKRKYKNTRRRRAAVPPTVAQIRKILWKGTGVVRVWTWAKLG